MVADERSIDLRPPMKGEGDRKGAHAHLDPRKKEAREANVRVRNWAVFYSGPTLTHILRHHLQ